VTRSPPYDAAAGDFDDPGDGRSGETGRHAPRHDGKGEQDWPHLDTGAEDADDLDDDRASAAEREELRRYEAEREERRRRRDSASRKVVAWVVAVALAFLLYDSGGALVRGASADEPFAADEPWGAHAVMAGLAALGLLALLVAGIRALRRR
jgi:2-methylaconitate cis-trans-isomerase PrpF